MQRAICLSKLWRLVDIAIKLPSEHVGFACLGTLCMASCCMKHKIRSHRVQSALWAFDCCACNLSVDNSIVWSLRVCCHDGRQSLFSNELLWPCFLHKSGLHLLSIHPFFFFFDSICLMSWGATGTQQTKSSVQWIKKGTRDVWYSS